MKSGRLGNSCMATWTFAFIPRVYCVGFLLILDSADHEKVCRRV